MAQKLKNHLRQIVATWRLNDGSIDRSKAMLTQALVNALHFEQERHLGHRRTIS